MADPYCSVCGEGFAWNEDAERDAPQETVLCNPCAQDQCFVLRARAEAAEAERDKARQQLSQFVAEVEGPAATKPATVGAAEALLDDIEFGYPECGASNFHEENVATVRRHLALARETTHCKDCKHWGTDERQRYWDDEHAEGADEEGQAPAPIQRICAAIKLLSGGDVHYSEPPDERRKLLAYTCDASSYKADLWTAGEFGCVLFEQTDVPTPPVAAT